MASTQLPIIDPQPPVMPPALAPSEAADWVIKTPNLLRAEAQKIPDQVPAMHNGFRIGGVVVGAVLTAATFSKYVTKGWKWLTGGAAVGSIVTGLVIGSAVDKMNKVMQCSLPKLKKAILDYADAMEKDETLRSHFGAYLVNHYDPFVDNKHAMDAAVVGRAVEFGQITGHLNIHKLSQQMVSDPACGLGR